MSLIPYSVRRNRAMAATSDLAAAEMAALRDLARVLTIMDVDSVPEAVLPYLAWQFRADVWQPEAPIAVRREQVRTALQIWMRRGTRWAVRTALRNAGVTATIVEWWQRVPAGVPHTFSISLTDAETGVALSGEMLERARAAVDRVKPVRSQYSLTQVFGLGAPLRLGAGVSGRLVQHVPIVARTVRGAAAGLGMGGAVSARQMIHLQMQAA